VSTSPDRWGDWACGWCPQVLGGLAFFWSTALLIVGGVGWLLGSDSMATVAWTCGTLVGLGFSVFWTAAAVRRRQPSVDVIALLALVGALVVGEPFAGSMITVMLASGRLLEARAARRARRDLSLLAERAPRIARRRTGNSVVEIPVDEVAVRDRLLVGSGEVVPVTGVYCQRPCWMNRR
jgi:cation transport ATPase